MNQAILKNIPESNTWKSIQKIEAGWSKDEKYLIESITGEKYLLRISQSQFFEEKSNEFSFIQKLSTLDFVMSRPISFGLISDTDFCYLLLTFVSGEDLEEILPTLPALKQYQLGIEAGKILKKIHQLPCLQNHQKIRTFYERKKCQLEKVKASPLLSKVYSQMILYLEENLSEIKNSPLAWQHGDFHVGNLIYLPSGDIGVIDFNRFDQGDAYEEFYKMHLFSREVSVDFTIGQLHGYFAGNPPQNFWKLHKIYVCHAALHSIIWAEKFGEEEIQAMFQRLIMVIADYENHEIIPKWYLSKE